MSIISIIFFAKMGKLVLRSLLLEGCYFRKDRYIQKFATFKGLLLSELFVTCPIGKAPGKPSSKKILDLSKQNLRAAYQDKLEFKFFQALFRHGE